MDTSAEPPMPAGTEPPSSSPPLSAGDASSSTIPLATAQSATTPVTPSSLSSVLDTLNKPSDQGGSPQVPNDPPVPTQTISDSTSLPTESPHSPAAQPTTPQATTSSTQEPIYSEPTTSPPQANQDSIGSNPPAKGKSRVVMYSVVGLLSLVAVGTILFLSQQAANPQPVINTETEAEAPPPPLTLTIDSPSDEAVVTNNVLTFKGKTIPNTTIAYFTETDEGTLESDNSGNFEGTITLSDGINTLTITAFGENGEDKSVTLDIVYDAES